LLKIEHWNGLDSLDVAESAGGVLATLDPLANVVRAGTNPWPPPELVQKLYASGRWSGKTDEDDRVVRECLGHYSDLQSLNSEDAITWSFFGPLIHGPRVRQLHFATGLFSGLGLQSPSVIALWLWRRIPHPEKPESTGGPELDFGMISDSVTILGEAKWNSQLAVGQGVARNRTQLDLRVSYCVGLGRRALPSIKQWVVLGVGRAPDVFDTGTSDATVRNMAWRDLLELMPADLQPELSKYLTWKEKYSSRRVAKGFEQ
jgi:hypothetical protein